MMRELIKKLKERANAYEEPYQGNHLAFAQSGASYAIATVMRELAIMLESVSDAEQLQDD